MTDDYKTMKNCKLIIASSILLLTGDKVRADVIADAPTIGTLLGNVLTFLLQIAGILGIISLVVSGMIIFLSTGDPERAKKAKEAATYSIIGMVVVLGAMVVVRMITGVL